MAVSQPGKRYSRLTLFDSRSRFLEPRFIVFCLSPLVYRNSHPARRSCVFPIASRFGRDARCAAATRESRETERKVISRMNTKQNSRTFKLLVIRARGYTFDFISRFPLYERRRISISFVPQLDWVAAGCRGIRSRLFHLQMYFPFRRNFQFSGMLPTIAEKRVAVAVPYTYTVQLLRTFLPENESKRH